MRAIHLTGRCIDCDACYNACPLSIPINLLTKKMLLDAKEHFGVYQPALKGDHLMSTFKADDKENFIQYNMNIDKRLIRKNSLEKLFDIL